MAVATAAVGALALAMAVMMLVSVFLRPKVDPREPPVVHPKVPFVGHLIGTILEGPLYFKRVSEQCKQPIFTLPILNRKTYMVVDPTLAAAVQRAASTLNFDELVVQAIPFFVKLNAQAKEILRNPADGKKPLPERAHGIINPPLAAHNISSLSQSQLNHFSAQLNDFKHGEVDLYDFFKRAIVAATMNCMFGPQNPFALHPELIQSFWDWDDGIIGYTAFPFPHITARKAHQGFEACLQGWREYGLAGRYEQAQPFIRERYELHMGDGIDAEGHARLEMGMILGFNSNASVSTFWILNNIFSRPDLLQQIRDEVHSNAFSAPGTIHAMKIKEACPLLNSVFRETLRLAAPMPSARIVLEDTLLLDNYLLRKGNMVQIAGNVINSDANIWGTDAASFNPRRFVYSQFGTKTCLNGSVQDSKANTVHPAAFRSFGGGSSLCPGRHFAQVEITGLAAMMVMGFDLTPLDGKWDPPRNEKRFPIVVIKPKRDVRVKMERRKGWENVKWVFNV
ncbi:hypothetical protein ACEQ8H_005497 [Pleosporales sp. CAS-2024a]